MFTIVWVFVLGYCMIILGNSIDEQYIINYTSIRIETNLKFYIQIVGMPSTIITINCEC